MPVPEYRRRGNDRYNAKCDYISVRPIKSIGAAIRAAAKAADQSVQGYVIQACIERMKREGQPLELNTPDEPPGTLTPLSEWKKRYQNLKNRNKTPADRNKTARRGSFIFSRSCTGIYTGSATPVSAAAGLSTYPRFRLSFSQSPFQIFSSHSLLNRSCLRGS